MNRLFLGFVLILVSTSLMIAQAKYDPAIKDSFSKYKKAYFSVDRSKLVDMSHPNIVAMGGGRSYMMEAFTQDYNMYSAQGLKLVDLNINKSSKVLKVDNDLQAMLPYVRSLDNGESIISEEGFFLIISQDTGQTWSFTDMLKYDGDSIKDFIPNYDERLNIYLESINH